MYESFYKLRAKPFRLSPSSGFFYPSRGHKRALDYLHYGLNQSEGFVVITGAAGTGKTTLAQVLLRELEEQALVIAHLTTTQLEADDMLRMVSTSFGLHYEGMDKITLLKTLEAFLLGCSQERKQVLLVIDEAQNLPVHSLEELRLLSNLQVGEKALLQTLLLGQTQFRQMLEQPNLEQLRQRIVVNYHLSALAPDECKDYVETRLKQVGWQGDPYFTKQAYAIIHKFSKGVPRRINMLCDRVLLFSYLEELHEINSTTLQKVTDELGQEVSGRPRSAVSPVDSLLGSHMGATSNVQIPETLEQAAQTQGKEKTIELIQAELPESDQEESLQAAMNRLWDDEDKPEPIFNDIDDFDLDLVSQQQFAIHDKKTFNDGNGSSGSIVRNLLLFAGVAATLLVLYITQIRGTDVSSMLEDLVPSIIAPKIEIASEPEPPSMLGENKIVNGEEFRVSEPPTNLETDILQGQTGQNQAEEEVRVREAAEADAQVEEEARVREAAEADAQAKEEARVREAAEAEAQAEEEARVREAAEAEAQAEEEARVRETTEADVKVTKGAIFFQKSRLLTGTDLNYLMVALVKYYEAGDIKGFMDLFSSDAQTSDHSTTAGIRSMYQSLFENTLQRRMELKDLQWTMDDGTARGKCDYVIEVQTAGRDTADIHKGTLQVQVESRGGLARITYLDFVE